MTIAIDTTFDFRSDTPPGADPDARSPRLRAYHRYLWSKPLPDGAVFELVDSTPRVYLHHRSALAEFRLTSDCVVPSFRKDACVRSLRDELRPGELDEFVRLSYTIGGMMLFPGNRVGMQATINGARGLDRRIKDRFDLTVECIRRHYRGEPSPLADVLARYGSFFRLFRDFRGYVEFFLLQDLVSGDGSTVRFFLPFDGFDRSPLPTGLESYRAYKQRATEFLDARNRRIQHWCLAHLA